MRLVRTCLGESSVEMMGQPPMSRKLGREWRTWRMWNGGTGISFDDSVRS